MVQTDHTVFSVVFSSKGGAMETRACVAAKVARYLAGIASMELARAVWLVQWYPEFRGVILLGLEDLLDNEGEFAFNLIASIPEAKNHLGDTEQFAKEILSELLRLLAATIH